MQRNLQKNIRKKIEIIWIKIELVGKYILKVYSSNREAASGISVGLFCPYSYVDGSDIATCTHSRHPSTCYARVGNGETYGFI